jgi:hypothetical protein
MEQIISYINEIGVVKLIGYLLGIIALIQIFIIFFVLRKNIIIDLRGKDLFWQLKELSAIIWLILFPILCIADIMGAQASDHVWTTFDFIYIANLGSSNLDNYINKKFSGNLKENINNKENISEAVK